MNRVLLVFFAVFAFAARSDGSLKCYMCDTLSNPNCGDSSKDGNSQPMECTVAAMTARHEEILRNPVFRNIASVFAFDPPQYSTHMSDLACAKMNLKLGPKNITMRSCESAKTPTVDTCRAINQKFAGVAANTESIGYCGLCYIDGCNGAVNIAAPKIIQLLVGVIGLMMLQAFRHRSA